jgi:predicted ATPase
MIGHRLMGHSLSSTGRIAEGRAHFDQSMALYDPAEHRPLSTRFGQDVRVAALSYRSLALWYLGFPQAALADTEYALQDARKFGQAAGLMYALYPVTVTHLLCGNYEAAADLSQELVALAEEKGALFWKSGGIMLQGCVRAQTGKASDSVQTITASITAWRSTGATAFMPLTLSYLARAYTTIDQFDDAWCSIDEAMTAVETTKERWWEPEINRWAGEIALKSPERDGAKAQAYFERALAVARAQQAKSWELRAAMSMARLWRDQGKRDEARELLAPVYGWFTEGFDTLDLREAKALLEELAA